jgi:hypothetical protein
MSDGLLIGAYVAIGVSVAVFMARHFYADDPDGSAAEGGAAALMAGIIWPLVVVVFGGHALAAGFYRVVTGDHE